MSDIAEDFEHTTILKQGVLEAFIIDLPKVSLHFSFPRRFEVHFNRVEDYRANFPLARGYRICEWWARRDSELLRSLPERRLRNREAPRDDIAALHHFHVAFQEGYLDVLAEDFVFMMVSRS